MGSFSQKFEGGAARESIIFSISQQLDKPLEQAAALESLSGNAGADQIAVNAYVDKLTGVPVAFGNPQHIDETILSNDRYAEVTFLQKVNPNTGATYISEVVPGDNRLTAAALDNIRGAIEVNRRVRDQDFREAA